MKILITGASGQLGLSFVEKLRQTSWEFFSFTREQLNITDKLAVDLIIGECKPDIIINTAAFTSVDLAEGNIEEAWNVNSYSLVHLSKAAEKVGALVVHFSTDYIFSGEKKSSYTEDDLAGPVNVYGASKLAGEVELIANSSKYLLVRTSWIFSEFGNNFVKKILRAAQYGNQLSIVNDQFGSPTYAGDVVDAVITMLRHYEANKELEFGVYNFTGQPSVSWFEFAVEIIDLAIQLGLISKDVKVLPVDSQKLTVKRPASSVLDCTKINAEFSICPSDWRRMLEKVLYRLVQEMP